MTVLITGSAALAVLVLCTTAPAVAQVTDKASAYATIARTLEVASASHMTFGTFVEPSEAGSAELSPVEGLVRCNMAPLGDNASKPAFVTVSADPQQTFGLALSDIARVGRGPLQIEVSSFTHDAGTTPVVDPDGARQLKLGATLYVTRNAPRGIYHGNFDVIVTNN
jgi:hypothetical protein